MLTRSLHSRPKRSRLPRIGSVGLLFALFVLCANAKSSALDSASLDQAQIQPAPESKQPTPAPPQEKQAVPGAAPDFAAESAKTPAPAGLTKNPLWKKALNYWLEAVKPNQGGILWLAIIVWLLVGFDFSNWRSKRNLDLLLLFLPTFLFIDIIRLSTGLQDTSKLALSGYVFLGIFLLTAILFARALAGVFRASQPWTPKLSLTALRALALALIACNIVLVFARMPDDCGLYTNLGAKRMLETGKYPYGDPLLRNGAAATYGPVLYIAHMPFQVVLPSPPPKPDAGTEARTQAEGMKKLAWPPVAATQLALLMFHVIGIAALFAVGKRVGGAALAWALVCLYCGSAYVQGIGGERWVISGMAFISHIAPAAVTLLAFALLSRPLWAGALLGVGAGVLFYPAFFFPVWFGYYFWRKKGWLQFTLGFAVVCLVIGASVLLMTETGEGETVLHVIHESTVGHQESAGAYGASTFSFWGTHPRLASFWQQPIFPGAYLFKPAFLIFLIFLAAAFFWSRGRALTQFAFLTASIPLAIQLWKTHAGGTYVEWYLAFFLIGLLGSDTSAVADKETKSG